MKNIQSKQFYDYAIYPDGTIINKYGKIMTHREREKENRVEVRLTIEGERKNYTLSRLLYWVFVEQFDMKDENLCVSFKDNNGLNIQLDNLYLTPRKDLIQGEKHRSVVKLSDKQIQEIRSRYKGKACVNQHDKTGTSLRDLAGEYGVTYHMIKLIVEEKTRSPKNYKLK